MRSPAAQLPDDERIVSDGAVAQDERDTLRGGDRALGVLLAFSRETPTLRVAKHRPGIVAQVVSAMATDW